MSLSDFEVAPYNNRQKGDPAEAMAVGLVRMVRYIPVPRRHLVSKEPFLGFNLHGVEANVASRIHLSLEL